MQEGILCCRSPVCADFRALVPTASTRSPIPNGATHAATTSSHGLTRNSRDFDALAASLADRYRIVCMDVVGRGSSDWLRHKGDYGFPLYLSDAAALLARITAPLPSTRLRRALYGAPRGRPRVDWIGTSMGGLIGLFLAAKPRSPIRRLVLNDVGPMVPWSALTHLKGIYTGHGKRFADLDEIEKHLRIACAAFGPLPHDQWRHVAEHSALRKKDGSYVLAYDPGIMSNLHAGSTAGIQLRGRRLPEQQDTFKSVLTLRPRKLKVCQ